MDCMSGVYVCPDGSHAEAVRLKIVASTAELYVKDANEHTKLYISGEFPSYMWYDLSKNVDNPGYPKSIYFKLTSDHNPGAWGLNVTAIRCVSGSPATTLPATSSTSPGTSSTTVLSTTSSTYPGSSSTTVISSTSSSTVVSSTSSTSSTFPASSTSSIAVTSSVVPGTTGIVQAGTTTLMPQVSVVAAAVTTTYVAGSTIPVVTALSAVAVSSSVSVSSSSGYEAQSGYAVVSSVGSVVTLNPFSVSGSVRPVAVRPEGDPVADAGGPYFSSPGVAVMVNASNSRPSDRIVDFVWDFGDNSSGRGPAIRHAYNDSGLYALTLSVADDAGRTSVDRKVVDVRPRVIYVYVVVFPSKDYYYEGDLLSGVGVSASYSDGTPVVGAKVSGYLVGSRNVSMVFGDLGGGKYHSMLNYPVSGEEDFIDIYVNVTDSAGFQGMGLKKLVVSPPDAKMSLLVVKPSGSEFAYGQEVEFRVRMAGVEGGSLGLGELSLHETWSGQKYRFRKEGDDYLFTYTVPSDRGNRALLILYGTLSSGGVKRKALKEVSLELSHDLVVKPVGLSDSSELLLNVTYPDGSVLPFSLLKAEVGNVSFFLQNNQGLFSGQYPSFNSSKSYVWVTDVYGNAGGSEVFFGGSQAGMEGFLMLFLMLFAGLLLVCVPLFVVHFRRRRQRERLREEYEDSRQKIASLEALQKKVMQDYYTRRITEEEARNRLFECDKELVPERVRFKRVVEKLGVSDSAAGKDDAVEWVADRLKLGEDAASIKESLEKMGLDPGLVDLVRKSMDEPRKH